MKIRALVGRHKAPFAAGGVVALGLGIFGIVWFQPHKLFIEKTVNEAPPPAAQSSSAPAATPSGASTPGPAPATGTIASGSFRSLEHRTTGRALLVRGADGSISVRLENLDTSNGPDLRVYLSEIPSDRGWHDYGERFVDLGALKGNRGSQNYVVPTGTDISKYRSVVIWCRRFTVGFGVAPLNPA